MNLLPTPVLGGVSPYEKSTGKKTFVRQLRVFGCLCFAKMPNNLDKFGSRSIPVVHIGYSMTQKGYKLLNLNTKSFFFLCRDVQFKEDVFPFEIKDDNGSSPIFSEGMLNDDLLFWYINVDNLDNSGDYDDPTNSDSVHKSTPSEVEVLPSSDNLGNEESNRTEPR